MSCTWSHAVKCGLELSNRSSIPSRTRDDTLNWAWATQCSAAYLTRGDPLASLLPACSSSWSNVARQACAMRVCAGSRSLWNRETSPCGDCARQEDVRNSFTEKWENCTTWESSQGMIVIKLEQVDSMACSWSSHRQSSFNVGRPPEDAVKSNTSSSASSSTRSDRTATVRHCNRRCALSFWAWFIPFNIRSYVSSSVSGNSFRYWRRFGGKQCCSTSNWQNTHRNLYGDVRTYNTHIPSGLSVSVSITRFLSSALHLIIAVLGASLTMLRT